jgi:DNA topoisomerase IA
MEKIKGGLSAGRVQSVSVRLIVERDIQNFNAIASYSIVPSLPMKQENHLRQNS